MLRWTPFQYYTSSPCEFYYACKGFFDKEENRTLVLRKVAQAASVGYVKQGDFEEFWPGPKGTAKETPSWSATTEEFRKKLIEDFKKR